MSRLRIGCALTHILIVAVCASSALAQDLNISSFNDASAVAGWDKWWGTDREITWDAAMDADGNAASGAMKIVGHFTTPGSWTAAVAIKWFGLGDVTAYGNIEMDVYVDPASAGVAGNHGLLQWYFARDDAGLQKNSTSMNLGSGGADGAWYHLTIPISGFPGYGDNPPSVSQFTFFGFEVGNDTLNGDVTFWIDNLKMTPKQIGPPPPTTPLVINLFNDPAEVADPAWHMEQWTGGTGVITFDATKDAGGGGAVSGSMKVVLTYSANNDCDDCAEPGVTVCPCSDPNTTDCPNEPQKEPPPHTGCNNTWLVRQFAQPVDASLYGSLEMDVLVASDSAVRTGYNPLDHGYHAWFTRTGDNWENHFPGGWGLAGGSTVQGEVWNDDVWYHLIIPLGGTGIPKAGLNDIRAISQQLWGGDAGAFLDGNVTMWIDNVMFVPPPQPPNGFIVIDQFDAPTGLAEVTAWRRGNADPATNANYAGDAPPALLTFDPAVDYNGDANSGSMRVDINFDTATYSNSELQIQNYMFGALPAGVDLRDYAWFMAKVKVLPGSALTPWGDHGWSNWVLRDPWTAMGGGGIPADGSAALESNGWYSYAIRFKSVNNPAREIVKGITYQFGGLNTGPYTMWIDEIKFGRTLPCADPLHCEICNNQVDDNGDGLVDCADPDCPGTIGCPIETTCDDHQDNDGDGIMDCADPDCGTSANCKSNDPFADLDGDQDVDQNDFAILQACFTGPDILTGPGCGMLDRDLDGDIDTVDVAKFVACSGSPNVPANQDCDNPQ